MIVVAVWLLLVLGQSPAQARETAAIDAAKQAIAHEIDPTLPRVTFERWLRDIVGAQAEITWEATDCGEQTGNPSLDKDRNFPVCAEARVALSRDRTLSVSLAVGTFREGVSKDPPDFWSAYLAEADGSSVWLASLEDVPAAVTRRQAGAGTRAAASASIRHSG